MGAKAIFQSLAETLKIGNLPESDNSVSIGSTAKNLSNIFTRKITANNKLWTDTEILKLIVDATNYFRIGFNGAGMLEIQLASDKIAGRQIHISGDSGGGGLYVGNNPAYGGNYSLIASNLITSPDNYYDLGMVTKRWKDLYLSGKIIQPITAKNFLEMVENCNQNIASMPVITTRTFSNIGCIENGTIENYNSYTYKIISGSTTGNNITIYGKNVSNPSLHTYYQCMIKLHYQYSDIQNETIFGVFDCAGNNMAYITKGTNANTVKFESSNDAGTTLETTDNISCDITSPHKYEIKIKSGHIYLYVDDIKVADHTTEIFLNADIFPLSYFETSVNASRYLLIEYLNVLLGRVF